MNDTAEILKTIDEMLAYKRYNFSDKYKGNLQDIIEDYALETITGDNRDWSRMDTHILKIPCDECDNGNRYFKVGVDYGLTEQQEDTYEKPEELEWLSESTRRVTTTIKSTVFKTSDGEEFILDQ